MTSYLVCVCLMQGRGELVPNRCRAAQRNYWCVTAAACTQHTDCWWYQVSWFCCYKL